MEGLIGYVYLSLRFPAWSAFFLGAFSPSTERFTIILTPPRRACVISAPIPLPPQLGLLLWLLYDPHTLFPGIQKDNACKKWTIDVDVVDEPSEVVQGFVCGDYGAFLETCTEGSEVRKASLERRDTGERGQDNEDGCM